MFHRRRSQKISIVTGRRIVDGDADLPPDMLNQVQRELAELGADAQIAFTRIFDDGRTRTMIRFRDHDGAERTCDSLDQAPPEVRELLERARSLAERPESARNAIPIERSADGGASRDGKGVARQRFREILPEGEMDIGPAGRPVIRISATTILTMVAAAAAGVLAMMWVAEQVR